MRRAIFFRFIEVLLAALFLNCILFFLVTNTLLLKDSRNNMQYMLSLTDSILDYKDAYMETENVLKSLDLSKGPKGSRLTIVDLDGNVLLDSGVTDETQMENHADRKEIEEAKTLGVGHASRYSKTLGKTMLYTALLSHDGQHILRMAMPFAGIQENLVLFLPAFWLSFVISLLVCIVIADKFSRSVSGPLDEIARQMGRMNEKHMELEFETCKYPEINVIVETTMKMSADLKAYLEQIERERHIRQEFFSNASHELKTPLTSVRGYAELLENGLITEESVKKDFLARILSETKHMANLINDILMISQLETREMEVVKTEVDVREVLLEAVDTVGPMAAERNVIIHTSCQPIIFYANVQQLKELFNNLLSNAVKYNRTSGAVWVSAEKLDTGICIRVRDTGVGIGKEHINRIFERFYRVDKGRSRKMGGTGLGLSIVKHIVNYYGGTITVNSVPDIGTEFIVMLPAQKQEQNQGK